MAKNQQTQEQENTIEDTAIAPVAQDETPTKETAEGEQENGESVSGSSLAELTDESASEVKEDGPTDTPPVIDDLPPAKLDDEGTDENKNNPTPPEDETMDGEDPEELGVGFIQAVIDDLPESEKTDLGFAIADILGTPNQPQPVIVSMVINAVLDKVATVDPDAKEALAQLSESIVQRAATQDYLTLVSKFEGVIKSGLPNASKLSVFAQQLDEFATRLG